MYLRSQDILGLDRAMKAQTANPGAWSQVDGEHFDRNILPAKRQRTYSPFGPRFGELDFSFDRLMNKCCNLVVVG